MKKTAISILLSILALLPNIGHSGTNSFICIGKVVTLGIHSTDRVILRLSNMSGAVDICNVGKTVGTINPVSAEQCKIIYSTLLTAYTMEKTVRVHFDNIEATACNNTENWKLGTARWVTFQE